MLAEPCVNSRGDSDVLHTRCDRHHRDEGQAASIADTVARWPREGQACAGRHGGSQCGYIEVTCIQNNAFTSFHWGVMSLYV